MKDQLRLIWKTHLSENSPFQTDVLIIDYIV